MNTSGGPLAGKKILVTRPKNQADSLVKLIEENGGTPLSFPIISIKAVKNEQAAARLNQLNTFQWIVFTSKNAVDYFFRLINELGISLGDYKFAAVGEKTAETLRRYGITSILVPERYDAADLAETLKKHVLKDERILFPKGNLAPSFLKEELKSTAVVEEMVVYKTEPEDGLDWSLIDITDCFFFMSPSAVSFMIKGLSDSQNNMIYKTPVICVGPTTKTAAEKCGFKHVFMPSNFTAEDMVNCAISYFQGGR
ncbi:uroporphyrinogen-III synthase [Fictibacillus sp. UD]|uniref:uroporphyrinogen-III synthase n=1 Tax=Fictibacillus sp. UD TaxID=3038777 RepID=UPI00374552E1